jgi:hypothetical protein
MLRRLFLSLIGLSSSTGVSIAKSLICGFCKKPITGRYFTYSKQGRGTLTICADCERRHHHCDACNIPIQKGVRRKNEILCDSCAKSSKYCSLCNKRISGKYYSSKEGDELYCSSCYHKYPRCAVCGTPGRAYKVSNKYVCPDCLPKLKKCSSCGKPIVGKYYTYNSSDESFCEDCHKHRDKCYCCGLPLGPQHWRFDDGRKVCVECQKRVITDPQRIKTIMKDVEGLCKRKLGLNVNDPYTLHVEALNKHSKSFAAKAKKGDISVSPLFGKELGLYRRLNGKSEIFLLYGLPIEMIYETAAHEYGHAWQAENCPHDQTDVLREGFAQWVAAQILSIKGYKTALEKLESRTDSPYGTGYLKLKPIHQNLGLRDFLTYVKKVKR